MALEHFIEAFDLTRNVEAPGWSSGWTILTTLFYFLFAVFLPLLTGFLININASLAHNLAPDVLSDSRGIVTLLLVVSVVCQLMILHLAHTLPWAVHVSRNKTYSRIASRFY